MKKILIALLLLAMPAMAQERKYTFTENELKEMIAYMSELKYKEAAPLIAFISQRLQRPLPDSVQVPDTVEKIPINSPQKH